MRKGKVEEILGWGDGRSRARKKEARDRSEAESWARERQLCVECGQPGSALGTDWRCPAHLLESDRCG